MANKNIPDYQAALEKDDFPWNKFRNVFRHIMKYENKYPITQENFVRKRFIFISLNKKNIFLKKKTTYLINKEDYICDENVATRHVTSLFFQKKQGFRNAKNRDIRENRGIVTKFTGRS
jgi:hypothetical protein